MHASDDRPDRPPRPRAHVRDRSRLRRPLRGDQARRGRRAGLPGRRARQRRRRHLARQHLPRRRLRRALAAVLLLLRPQPRVVAFLLPPAGDPGLHPAGRRAAPACSTGSASRPSLEEARWDEAEQLWHVRTSGRSAEPRPPTCVVSAAGALSDAKLPDIDGIDSFAGEVFHSSQWRHDHDLTGKRVAVIGTGASAIQIVPEIAEQVAHLDVYQRTAPHVIPRRDRAYTASREARLQARPRACRRPTARRSTGRARRFVPGLRLGLPHRRAGQEGCAAEHPQRHLRPGAARPR